MFRIHRSAALATVFALGLAVGASAVERSRNTRTPGKAKPQQSIAEAELALPADSVMGEDHQKNLATLLNEKLETLRNRLDILTRAMAVGKATQNQVDHATIEQLQAELESLDRPHLRIQTLKKIVEVRQKIEEEAKQSSSTPRGRPGDPSAWLAAHSRYTSTKLARINAQIALEREQLAQQAEMGKADAPAEKDK